MATKFMHSTETNPLDLQKSRKKPQISSLKSILAFLFALLLYLSVFYAFNHSTSTLVCSTKFWFFISNTLIFILAADFGAFSSSKEADYYFYSNTIQYTDCVTFPFQPLHPKNVEINYQKEEVYRKKPQEKIINMIYSGNAKHDDHISEEKIKPADVITSVELEKNADKEKLSETFETKKQGEISIPRLRNEAQAAEKRAKSTAFRSKSAIVSKIDVDELVVKRTLSMGREEPARYEKNDEYSRMSDEELNRRVEEFIRRSNRQIRLQSSNI